MRISDWSSDVCSSDLEAADIVLENDATGAQTEKHQKRMMVEIAKLLGTDKPGYLDPAAYQRTVDTLLANPSTPLITKDPEGAWTHVVWEKAPGTEPGECRQYAKQLGTTAGRGQIGRGPCRDRGGQYV